VNAYDEIDTGELLECLQSATRELALQNRRLEAIKVRGCAKGLLKLVIGFNLRDLSLNSRMIWCETADPGKSAGGIFMAVLLDEKSRSLGQ
jgi:hypothetical protein